MVNTLCVIVVHIICHELGGINKKKPKCYVVTILFF